MGCGAGSGCKKDDRRLGDRIDYDMDTTYIGEFDSMFKDCRELLQILEEVRYNLKELPEDVKEWCEIDRLKVGTFEECIKVWMWTISGNNGGSIAKAGFDIVDEVPYFKVNCSGCYWECWWIQDYFQRYIQCAIGMPSKVADTLVTLGSLAEKAASLDPVGAIESSDLGLLDKAKAAKAFAVNVKKTAEGLARAKEVSGFLVDAAVTIKNVVMNMKTWLTECDIIGKQAYDKQLWRPYQIVRDLHPGPKKTPEELKTYEEWVNKNKCTCAKCLKELEEQAKKDKK